jgi:hypothetical protein
MPEIVLFNSHPGALRLECDLPELRRIDALIVRGDKKGPHTRSEVAEAEHLAKHPAWLKDAERAAKPAVTEQVKPAKKAEKEGNR